MLMELDRNEILKSTVTEKFTESVRENLVPRIGERYGADYLGIIMYEDFLNAGFERDGVWYYPLTVRTRGGALTEWICWDVSDGTAFRDGIPYSYVGEGLLEFAYATTVPEDILAAFSGRAIDYSPEAVKIKVCAENTDPTFLSGKFSQTFLDELARQISCEIENNLAVVGLAKSTIELSLVLAGNTYMEHTSDNVTYRRLLLTDKGCQARDFWVKWTRLDGALSFTVMDNVSADTVKFELGEDVPQKIREKEFRFLARANPQRYQSAMGKRTVTEWRELIKRALKRGELERVEVLTLVDEKASTADDMIKQLASEIGITAPAANESVEIKESSDFERAMEMARAALMEQGISPVTSESRADATELFIDKNDYTYEINGELVDCSPPSEIDVELAAAGFSLDDEEAVEEADEPPFDVDPCEPEKEEDSLEAIREEALKLAEQRAKKEAEAEYERLREENLQTRRDADARLKYEAEARKLLEEEKERLRLEQEALRREVEKLRQEIDVRTKAEARERERLSEAARLAVLEQQRKDEERRLNEMREEENAIRLAKEAAMKAEAERIEEERRREAERIRREAEERARKEAEKQIPAEPEYMSKQAKLLFRRRMDSDSVKKKIRTIVEDTLIAQNKTHVLIHMKAYATDDYTMNIDILKMPKNESELLVSIVRAIGNGGLGITKIILEDM